MRAAILMMVGKIICVPVRESLEGIAHQKI